MCRSVSQVRRGHPRSRPGPGPSPAAVVSNGPRPSLMGPGPAYCPTSSNNTWRSCRATGQSLVETQRPSSLSLGRGTSTETAPQDSEELDHTDYDCHQNTLIQPAILRAHGLVTPVGGTGDCTGDWRLYRGLYCGVWRKAAVPRGGQDTGGRTATLLLHAGGGQAYRLPRRSCHNKLVREGLSTCAPRYLIPYVSSGSKLLSRKP